MRQVCSGEGFEAIRLALGMFGLSAHRRDSKFCVGLGRSPFRLNTVLEQDDKKFVLETNRKCYIVEVPQQHY